MAMIPSFSFKGIRKSWFFLAMFPILICFIPLIFIFISAGELSSDSLSESFSFFSIDSIGNTCLVCFFVLFFSTLIGTGFAYLFSHYKFFGSRFFEFVFILPIAIPGYIMAVTYSSFFDYGGYFQHFTGSYLNIMNMYGLIAVLTLTLYPYIFINALNAFKLTSGNYSESARLLGTTKFKYVLKILIPMSLPALVAGIWLTLMETLNDFGAASYFGIRTLSTEIIRCWQIGPAVTVFLSLCIMIIVILLLIVTQKYLSKKGFYQASKSRPIQKSRLTKGKSFIAFTGCTLFFILSFLLPVIVLSAYAWNNDSSETTRSLIIRSYNSIVIAATGALIILVFCLIGGYNSVIHPSSKNKFIAFLADFGYAVPGAVLAIALISLSAFINTNTSIALTGTLFFLVSAYTIRFYAVARQPIESLYGKLPKNLYNAGVNLGNSPIKTFYKLYLPLLWPGIITTFLLVVIDILKELPLTLILRPFNFETLSTSVYGYAKVNESVQQASPYALLIIFLGVLAVVLFMFAQRKYGNTNR